MAQGKAIMDKERWFVHSHSGIQKIERLNWFSYGTKQCMATVWIIPNMFSFRQLRFSADDNAESTVFTTFNVHRVVLTVNRWLTHGKKGRRKRMTIKGLQCHSLPARPQRIVQKGGLRTRRPMSIETLLSSVFFQRRHQYLQMKWALGLQAIGLRDCSRWSAAT